jgi:hypothetical protein
VCPVHKDQRYMKPMPRFQPQYGYHHQDDSTRFLGEWTSLSTTNGDCIQPSRKLLLEVSDLNFSSFILD